jgi:hypothetical protein
MTGARPGSHVTGDGVSPVLHTLLLQRSSAEPRHSCRSGLHGWQPQRTPIQASMVAPMSDDTRCPPVAWRALGSPGTHRAPATTARTAVGGAPSPRITSITLDSPPSRPCSTQSNSKGETAPLTSGVSQLRRAGQATSALSQAATATRVPCAAEVGRMSAEAHQGVTNPAVAGRRSPTGRTFHGEFMRFSNVSASLPDSPARLSSRFLSAAAGRGHRSLHTCTSQSLWKTHHLWATLG